MSTSPISSPLPRTHQSPTNQTPARWPTATRARARHAAPCVGRAVGKGGKEHQQRAGRGLDCEVEGVEARAAAVGHVVQAAAWAGERRAGGRGWRGGWAHSRGQGHMVLSGCPAGAAVQPATRAYWRLAAPTARPRAICAAAAAARVRSWGCTHSLEQQRGVAVEAVLPSHHNWEGVLQVKLGVP